MNGEVESVNTSVGVDGTGRVSRPVRESEMSPSALRRERVVTTTLRGRCAHAHLPCQDNGDARGALVPPVPPAVPGEFLVPMGACVPPCGLDVGAAALLLTWVEWCEVEVQSFPDLVERMWRLRGAVMAAGAFG